MGAQVILRNCTVWQSFQRQRNDTLSTACQSAPARTPNRVVLRSYNLRPPIHCNRYHASGRSPLFARWARKRFVVRCRLFVCSAMLIIWHDVLACRASEPGNGAIRSTTLTDDALSNVGSKDRRNWARAIVVENRHVSEKENLPIQPRFEADPNRWKTPFCSTLLCCCIS